MSIATTIPTPAAGTSESIKLEPGTTHQFGFKLSDIVNATPRPDGALELKLSNNSTVVIENFKDLVNSKDICGEDSALLLLDEKAGNEFNMVNLVKSMSSRFEDRVANDNEIVLNAPNAQATKEVMIQPGMKYVVNFDMDQVGKTQDGDNLILSFQNGGIMILRDYAAVASGELPAALTLADGSVIDANSLITGACAVNMPQVAALAAPDIEPAAGDEAGAQSKIAARSIAEKVADIAPAAGTAQKMASAAQDLANIEPAAGGEGAGPSRGYGFTSTRDVVALGGLNPLGPIGPTDLNGEPPSVPPSVGGAVDRVVPPVVPPTPTPPSINVDGVIILEDTVATVPMSIALTNGNPAEILTVVVSGIPAGWTVLNANGTYDAGAGTWTITLPAGQNFNGDLLLKPPADSDIDSPILTVTATSSVAGTASDTFDVRIDAVADAPTLTVPNVGGEEGTAINFPITTAVTDTDGSESIIRVEITGVPVGVTLSAGVLQPGGVWVLTPAELAGLTLNTTNGTTGTYVLTVTSFSREVNTSGLEPNLLNNDANTSKQITLTIGADDVPTLTPATNQLDETAGQAATITGTVTGTFGADGPGTFAPNNTFSFNGSSGPTLTSGGVAVVVTQSGNTYTGTAGGVTVFSLTVNGDGTYSFTQNKPLDHADGTDANDTINLVFGVRATDTDGDPGNTTITVRVIDDAPVAANDSYNVSGASNTATGDVIANDDLSNDVANTISAIRFGANPAQVVSGATVINGAFGVLTINPNGTFSYTANNGATGTDVFTYTLKDSDGDTSTATITFTAADGKPVIGDAARSIDETGGQPVTITGALAFDYGTDGKGAAGSIAASNSFTSGGSLLGGNLTSNGVPVTVTLVGNTYTGTAGGVTVFSLTLNGDGTYSFTQNKPLDHADGANANDVITLAFGVRITDADGDVDPGTITISIVDDAPVAANNSYNVSGASNTATGDVIANDDLSNDVANTISAIRFGANPAQAVSGATVINGAFGVLTINPNGTFSYTANNGATGSDVFTYTLKDSDGDTSTATITFTAADGKPVIGDAASTVDETNLGPVTVNGSYTFNYGPDGQGATGSIKAVNNFTFGGSLLGGNLTSNGVPVTVALVGNTFTGTAGGQTVFTLTVNTNGTYSFTLVKPIDHADGTNPDDAITLNFGTLITDADGDTDPGTITITVKDDGVDAKCNFVSTDGCHPTVTGNALAEAVFSKDGGNTIVKINFNGTDYSVPASGNLVVSGAFGVLTVAANGAYSYTATNGANGQDKFFYTLKDFDGDTDAACITVTVSDGMPTATDTTLNTDETTINVLHTGTITAGFGTDGPGSMFFTPDPRGFVAGGALFNGQLTSNGVPVTVAIVGGKYIGTAGGQTVFEVTLSQSGAYTFKQFRQLDHGETTNTNEIITLSFCYDIVDCDGEQATANLIIRVADDAPIARNDVVDCLKQTSVSGNVVLNDTIGNDYDPIILYSVQFKAQVITLTYGGSTTIQGDYGTLFIDSRGNYTYTLKPGETGNRMDTFTYRLCDTDLDKASATLTIKICDDIPIVVDPTTLCVDETNLNPTTAISGAISVNYGADGPGFITGTNTFSASGSIMGASLTSKGAAVAVALVGDTYFGTAGGREVFTLKLNANGTYTFTLKDQLDHGDPNNTNESMTLSFGFKATDVDGDATNGIVKICVQDDAPTATNDINTVLVCDCALFGNVLVNDRIGADENCFITKVSFNGVTYDVAQTTTFTTIVGTYGKLEINQNGNFIYTPTATTGTDVFTYKAVDFDGDSATATLQFNNAPNGTAAPAIAAAEPVAEQPISVLSFDDDLQVAINTFVSATDAGPAPIKAAEITPVAMPIDTHVANDNLDQQHNASTFG